MNIFMNDIDLYLCDDVKYVIFTFIPVSTLALCNKQYWIINYKQLLINRRLNKSYYRFLIRKDFNMIFKYFMDYYFKLFIKKKKIYYSKMVFQSYFCLFKYLTSQVYNSQKCLKILNEKLKLQDKKKYKYKNVKIISNKWTN